MNLWIDCEWNEFGGNLISVALVSQDGREFYEVLPCPNPGPWVSENVIPILGKEAIEPNELINKLASFLAGFEKIHVIADWPEDIQWFCRMLIVGPGMRINTPPLTMEIVRIDSVSDQPHNALADARGIMRAMQ
jgi:hypothetical protein